MSGFHVQQALREIPPVDRLLASEGLRPLAARVSHPVLVRGLRTCLDDLRRRVRAEAWSVDAVREHFAGDAFVRSLDDALHAEERSAYRRVINATGVVLHTGLGRAPLPAVALRAIDRELRGYSIVELDLDTGERSRREQAVVEELCTLTGAEAGTVVNNNAAAVHLALHANLRGREAVVSRGELVEIGGGFRVPEVLRTGGVTLVEVGTTNRTRLRDYEAAIGPRTGALLKVHTSNFRVVGFTEDASVADLAALAHREGLPLLVDLGSGMLEGWPEGTFPDEPRVRQVLAQGADLVTFSGDKLLGGPQCGIALGHGEWIERMRRDTLFRVLRVDKLVLVALEACVRLWRDPERAGAELPVARMLLADPKALRRRAGSLARRMRDACGDAFAVDVAEGGSQAGSGSVPGVEIPSAVVRVTPGSGSGAMPADSLARALRRGEPPVLTRVHREAVQLDLRTLLPGEDREVVAAFRALARGASGASSSRNG